ncbi:type I restriction enzyme endonuclease domain-containing protein [Deefgea sp. CFH1-16]|uniref:type I restriction enzyme endonuclease domain-containing protein n=1 Tax=Deefgea sp. CFH1-16 TaxID=2675457 RepID=UPI00194037C0|nr:type I restriction enzyme endonuclease domain-containing protein [Deefgea sp. CFH1-16]
MLERLLEGEIKSKFASNVVQQRKFSELLTDVVKRYQNRSIETAQVDGRTGRHGQKIP